MSLTKTEIKDIWEEVKANHARLSKCPRHEFVPMDDNRVLPRRFKCASCGGTLGAVEAHWYTKGLKHATQERQATDGNKT